MAGIVGFFVNRRSVRLPFIEMTGIRWLSQPLIYHAQQAKFADFLFEGEFAMAFWEYLPL